MKQTRQMRLELDDKELEALRVAAVRKRLTLTKAITAAVLEWIEKNEINREEGRV
jgi:hypothetical protein